MSRVLFDIGNTRLKWATYRDGRLGPQHAVSHAELDNEISAELKDAIEGAEIWCSNVAGQDVRNKLISGWLDSVPNELLQFASVSDSALGLRNGYANLKQLGIDRWVAAIGARSLVRQGDLIVIDAGTAVTIDWLDSDSTYQGGVILPGAGLMHDALVGKTAGIKSDFSSTQRIIGKTTSECVNSGVSFGLLGAVERVVNEMSATIARPTKILLTGGASDMIDQGTDFSSESVPDLVMHGLAALANNETII